MRVIFLDRDGVINKYPGDFEYVKSWKEFHFLPKIKPALKRLNDNGFKIFIISNQAGVAKGIYTKGALEEITGKMLKELSDYKINIEGVYYCTHLPQENCLCRKPNTGLVQKAIARLNAQGQDIDIPSSYFIGDSIKDVETGRSMGLRTILVFSGKERPENKNQWQILPDLTARDLSEAVDSVLKDR